jgi:hypothetical protein
MQYSLGQPLKSASGVPQMQAQVFLLALVALWVLLEVQLMQVSVRATVRKAIHFMGVSPGGSSAFALFERGTIASRRWRLQIVLGGGSYGEVRSVVSDGMGRAWRA